MSATDLLVRPGARGRGSAARAVRSTARAVPGVPVVLLSVLLTVLLVPTSAHAGDGDLDDDPTVARLLYQSARAAQDATYTGTQMVTVWSPDGTSSVLASVTHSPSSGGWYSFAPSTSAGTTGTPSRLADVPGGSEVVQLLLQGYVVRAAGEATVAGRSTYVVDVLRPDHTAAARLWLDEQTCLQLRREVYDTQGRVIRASSYLDVTLSAGSPDADQGYGGLAASIQSLRGRSSAGTRAVDTVLTSGIVHPVNLELARASAAPAQLAGTLELLDAERLHVGRDMLTHLLYTDGLSSVSVFVQAGSLDAAGLHGFTETRVAGTQVYASIGAPSRLTWAARGHVYTVVADAPQETLTSVVSSLPHTEPAGGFGHRVKRGAARVIGWLNPFD